MAIKITRKPKGKIRITRKPKGKIAVKKTGKFRMKFSRKKRK